MNERQTWTLLLLGRRKRRVARVQLTPGPLFREDRGDLQPHETSEDWEDLSAAADWEELNLSEG